MAASTVLRINASGRYDGSRSRALSGVIVDHLVDSGVAINVIDRDLAAGIEFVDEAWIAATFTPEQDRTDAQRARLRGSDVLVEELFAADIIVIGMPIYNFGVPAVLKAWVDQVARARKTFRYTADGPVGLIEGKKVYLVVASGGVPVDSDLDFATGYMRHVLGFIGLTDVTVIEADKPADGADVAQVAAAQVARLFGPAARAA